MGNTEKEVFIDFETRSTIDLKACGVDVYASHISTEPLCVAYAIGDADPLLWVKGEPVPIELFIAIEKGAKVIAHNFPFEWNVWNKCCVPKFGWPKLPIEQGHCTMAMAYNMGLPGNLEEAANAAGVIHKKDAKGHRIMMQISQPRDIIYDANGDIKEVIWWSPNDPALGKNSLSGREKFDWLFRYCQQDVVVERELWKRLCKLSKRERDIWLLDHKINERGVSVDERSARVAISIVGECQKLLNAEIQKVTNGQVDSFNAVAQLVKWLNECGIETKSIAKSDVIELLAQDDLPSQCRRALEIRQEGAKSSTAKLSSIISGVSSDGRVRGCFQYYGASATGRWAGRRIQLQNLPRPKISDDEIAAVFEIFERVGV